MPGTSPLSGWRIPLDSDVLGNVYQYMRDLVDDIEAGWTAYTPTIANLTIGNGTKFSRYKRFGKSLKIRHSLVGGSTTAVAGVMSIPLPAGMATPAFGAQTFMLRHWNGAAIALGGGWINLSSSTMTLSTTALPGGINALGNGHAIDISAELELA